MTRLRLSRISALVFTAGLTALALRADVLLGKACFSAGQHGSSLLHSLARAGAMSVLVIVGISLVTVLLLRKRFGMSFVFFVCLLATESLLFGLAVAKGARDDRFVSNFCSGIAKTLRAKISDDQLQRIIIAASTDARTNGPGLYKLDASSPINRIFRGPRPSVVSTVAGGTNCNVLILWPRVGGGFGIWSGESEPPRRVWLDYSVPYLSNVCVVSRGE